MAVIFAVVGGGAVVGIATTPVPGDSNYSDYDNYSNYSNYDNYSNYSDAAERQRRRREEKERELNGLKCEINQYKSSSVNPQLTSSTLKNQAGVSVNVDAVEVDGNNTINTFEKSRTEAESAELRVEAERIEKLLNKIDKVLEEE